MRARIWSAVNCCEAVDRSVTQSAPQQITSLFDHLVGERQEEFRICEPERLNIDDNVKFGRKLNGRLGWFSAFER